MQRVAIAPGPGERPGYPAGGRAHRRPGQRHQRPGHGPSPGGGEGPAGGHGHPQSELAEQYATRIVNLRDGKIRSDSDPYEPEGADADAEAAVHKNMGKASMSLLTALSLSFNNLKTKKARTILTSFAGSIGIIGIALILSLSSGVNDYIKDVEHDTLSEYPCRSRAPASTFLPC